MLRWKLEAANSQRQKDEKVTVDLDTFFDEAYSKAEFKSEADDLPLDMQRSRSKVQLSRRYTLTDDEDTLKWNEELDTWVDFKQVIICLNITKYKPVNLLPRLCRYIHISLI